MQLIALQFKICLLFKLKGSYMYFKKYSVHFKKNIEIIIKTMKSLPSIRL